MSRTHHQHSPRNRTPVTAPRPGVAQQTWASIESSTDPRAGETCKLQRLEDGTCRILLTEQMGRPATHGYQVALADLSDGLATLHTTGESFDEYVVMAAQWAAIQPQPVVSPELEMAMIFAMDCSAPALAGAA